MITDADIKKMKTVFAKDFKSLNSKIDRVDNKLNNKLDNTLHELLDFIVETKNDIMKELNEFRNEMRDINRGNESILNNHESRITHFEYINKS